MSDQRPSLAGSIALITIGLLVLVPSGLCTASVLITPLFLAIRDPRLIVSALGNLPLALLVGGPFILFGGFMVWRGINRLRARRGMP